MKRWVLITAILLAFSLLLWAAQTDDKTSTVHGDATTIGQIVIFLTFLINTGIQIWREKNARKDRAEERAQLREQLNTKAQDIKQTVKDEVGGRVAGLHKRLDGLLGDSRDERTQRGQ